MKTKILILSLATCFLLFSCNKSEITDGINAEEVAANSKIDSASDDVLQIVESQSNEMQATGKSTTTSSCATVTTIQNGTTWVRTVDFGATNCTLANGNTVRGKIIVTFTNNFTSSTRTISYTFDSFYHNDRHIEGSRTVVKTILPNGHPQATIDLNMTVTNTDGSVYTRVGQRVREFTAGYTTAILEDNSYAITGNWTTTGPTGNVHTATITAPIIINLSCAHIVQGTISFTRRNSVAVLDYGNGACDALATLTINGVVRNIVLGN